MKSAREGNNMPPYKIKINHMQIYGFYQIITAFFFGGFGLFMAHDAKAIDQEGFLFGITFVSISGALMFTVATSLFIHSEITSEGIVYGRLILGRETLLWSEIDDVNSQFTFPYCILRKRLPDGISVKFEEINNVMGSKVCCLPKLAFVKNQD